MVLTPVPVIVLPSGLRVSIHVSDEGSPPITTLPAGRDSTGWVMLRIAGAEGVGGCGFITT